MRVLRTIITFSIVLTLNACQESVSKTDKIIDIPTSQISDTSTIQVVDASEFADAVEGNDVQLIDVRTINEWNSGHLEGALHFEMNNKDWSYQIETLDKEAPVYVYCGKGSRSATCAQQLKEAGFKKIIDLDGGVTSWKAAGFPLR